MSKDKFQKQSDSIKDSSTVSPEHNRRRLLKNTVAIPIIMTLSSSVAAQVARTSNLVTPIENLDVAAKNTNGDLLCVHPGPDGSVDVVNERPVDLGTLPSVTVDSADSADLQASACQREGGILISATAYASLSGKGVLPDSSIL